MTDNFKETVSLDVEQFSPLLEGELHRSLGFKMRLRPQKKRSASTWDSSWHNLGSVLDATGK